MANEADLAKALLSMWREEEADLQRRVIDQENALADTKRELDILQRGIEALAARAGDEAPTFESSALTGEQTIVRSAIPPTDYSRPVSPTRRKTPNLVVEILRELNRPLTRDEIFEEFERRGLTEGYSRPLNAINTAVQRARERGWIVQVDHISGRYALPSPTGRGDVLAEGGPR